MSESPDRRLTVVVDDVFVDYRSYSSGKAVGNERYLFRRQRGLRVVHALRGVSFAVREGESIGVIGRNGSGKSTLMGAIAGLISPVRGAVYASSRPTLLGVGAVLMPDLPGSKNVIIGSLAQGMTRAEIEGKYADIADFAGVQEFMDMPMRTYSSGMSSRLRFAIAVASEHSILLVDEALAVGDKDFRRRSEARIRELREQASTVFLVSHSMASIRDTCTRVLWVDKGKIKLDGPTDEVVAAYEASK